VESRVVESQKNLSAAIEMIQKEKKKVILGGLYMPPNYGLEYTAQFRKMYADLAKKYSVPLIPFILEKVAGDPNFNQSDGIHPNEKGHKIIAETIFSSLKEYL
jgi:acyl-CoA thioesterase-1